MDDATCAKCASYTFDKLNDSNMKASSFICVNTKLSGFFHC